MTMEEKNNKTQKIYHYICFSPPLLPPPPCQLFVRTGAENSEDAIGVEIMANIKKEHPGAPFGLVHINSADSEEFLRSLALTRPIELKIIEEEKPKISFPEEDKKKTFEHWAAMLRENGYTVKKR